VTPRQESLYPDDWRAVGRQDWHRIHVMLADGDADAAGLFLQQALEKYLKAYLLTKGWKLKKVHTLQSLLDEAAAHDSTLMPFRGLCERVSAFYIAERYPSLGGSGLEPEEVKPLMPEARALVSALFPTEILE
jgi:HEPN domain-containing protein